MLLKLLRNIFYPLTAKWNDKLVANFVCLLFSVVHVTYIGGFFNENSLFRYNTDYSGEDESVHKVAGSKK